MNEIKDRIPDSLGFSIGGVNLRNKVISAPMAGVTDKAFRLIAEWAGCGLVYTEMVSANALHYNSDRTKNMLDLSGERGPTSVQIFGNKPEIMQEAAKAAEENGSAIIDINMGCPAPKVVKNFEGCALMTNIPLAGRIIETVVGAVNIPVTIKIRKGWDEGSVNAVELAKVAEQCGAAAVTVHGRTRDQFYSGKADWDIIGEVKKKINIPVIGNGDVIQPEDALDMLRKTGCDGIMIGRGALGNPWLFERTARLLESGELVAEPSYEEKIEKAKRHFQLVVQLKGEQRAVKEMRKHMAWYIRGLRDSTSIRELINNAVTEEELIIVMENYEEFLASH